MSSARSIRRACSCHKRSGRRLEEMPVTNTTDVGRSLWIKRQKIFPDRRQCSLFFRGWLVLKKLFSVFDWIASKTHQWKMGRYTYIKLCSCYRPGLPQCVLVFLVTNLNICVLWKCAFVLYLRYLSYFVHHLQYIINFFSNYNVSNTQWNNSSHQCQGGQNSVNILWK